MSAEQQEAGPAATTTAGLASVPFELAPHGQLAVLAVDEIERLS